MVSGNPTKTLWVTCAALIYRLFYCNFWIIFGSIAVKKAYPERDIFATLNTTSPKSTSYSLRAKAVCCSIGKQFRVRTSWCDEPVDAEVRAVVVADSWWLVVLNLVWSDKAIEPKIHRV